MRSRMMGEKRGKENEGREAGGKGRARERRRMIGEQEKGKERRWRIASKGNIEDRKRKE